MACPGRSRSTLVVTAQWVNLTPFRVVEIQYASNILIVLGEFKILPNVPMWNRLSCAANSLLLATKISGAKKKQAAYNPNFLIRILLSVHCTQTQTLSKWDKINNGNFFLLLFGAVFVEDCINNKCGIKVGRTCAYSTVHFHAQKVVQKNKSHLAPAPISWKFFLKFSRTLL